MLKLCFATFSLILPGNAAICADPALVPPPINTKPGPEYDGKTWSGPLVLDERAGVSYPDGVQAPDGTITIIYDFERTKTKQILMAAFTEADVAAGKFQSPTARQKVVINQATGERRK